MSVIRTGIGFFMVYSVCIGRSIGFCSEIAFLISPICLSMVLLSSRVGTVTFTWGAFVSGIFTVTFGSGTYTSGTFTWTSGCFMSGICICGLIVSLILASDSSITGRKDSTIAGPILSITFLTTFSLSIARSSMFFAWFMRSLFIGYA